MASEDGLYPIPSCEAAQPEIGRRGRLFLGTQQAAQDRSLLRRYAVSRIVCVGTPAFHQQQEENVDGRPKRGDEGDCSDGTTSDADVTGDLVYLEVNIKDLPSENLLGRLDACVAFIENGMRRGETVLVNCVYAQSRSAAVVVAYLMCKGLSLSQATDKVREAQPTVHINPGFEAQLQLYYDLGCRLPDTKPIDEDTRNISSAAVVEKKSTIMAGATYRWFSFAKRVQEEGLRPCTASPPRAETRATSNGAAYRCKACRALLFRESNILDHAHPLVRAASDSVFASFSRHGDGSSWLKARDAATAASFSTKKGLRGAKGRYQPRVLGRGVKYSSCRSKGVAPSDERCNCTSVFTEALDWVRIVDSTCSREDIAHTSSGKIMCPGRKGAAACGSKLGSWSLGGITCSCGRIVKPAIQFTLGRIERVHAL